jgi:hypothetical protein
MVARRSMPHNKPLQTDESAAEPVPVSAANQGVAAFGCRGGRLVRLRGDRCTLAETF